MSAAPKNIPFNTIDRSYLITESEKPDASHFPMSPVGIIKLKEPFSQTRLVAALQTIAKKYPYLRLGYQLDSAKTCWRLISEAQLDDFLAAAVHVLPEDRPIEAEIGRLIAENNEALAMPVNLFIAGEYLLLRMHHSFGDGKFLNLLLYLLVCEHSGRTAAELHFAPVWWKPIWRIIWQNFGQGSQILWGFVKTVFASYEDFKSDTQEASEKQRSPIVSGAAMAVRYKPIPADVLAILNEARGDFSLNTVLQVMVAAHLERLGIQGKAIVYTIPVDLRRYLPDSEILYPGNLASQIRIRLETGGSLFERCAALQKEVTEQLDKKAALVTVPGEWLLALSGKKTYQAVNRDWLLKSTYNDPRKFVLSNVGKLDSLFGDIADLLAEDFPPQIAIPLMGGPALVFCFNSFQGHGNILFSYDPTVFSDEQIDEVLCVFERPAIEAVAQGLREK